MKKCYLVDIDQTLVEQGTNVPIPGAIEKVNQYYDEGHMVFLFTCWPDSPDARSRLQSLGIKFHGMVPKPFADEYVVLDDKLNIEESRTHV